ncbi:MAG: dihydroorotate dehydrogenase [Sedimentisphaerales bacterium]|nr:dihydroorotate dehydrogenase [Sedimentisphaerales bacterium]
MSGTKQQPDLSTALGGVKPANPVMTASGTCGYAFELGDFVDLSRLGAFVTKSITLEPREGNKPQRTVETAAGMLNAIGLANIGLKRFCAETLPLLRQMNMPIFVNVAGRTQEDYLKVCERLAAEDGLAGLELNVSCPNVKEGGITFGTDPQVLGRLVAAVREVIGSMPLMVKLTPNVTDITVTARAAVDAGADVLSLVNTFTGMAIDAETRRCVLGNRTGGLSGPAIKPIALYMVHRVYTEVARSNGIALVGMGGIACATDALEFILAGASAVAVGTAVLARPAVLTEIIDGVAVYLQRHGYSRLQDIVGSLEA